MQQLITGIHHVTAIASSAQKNLEFYAGVLGLRLVKKTINYDGPDVYHLYYGDQDGNPGTILTFFPYEGLPNGRHGKGGLNTTSFSVPSASMNYWLDRFSRFHIACKKPIERFGSEVVIYFEDEDGLGLEFVFNETDTRTGFAGGPVPVEHAVRGFYNVELWEEGYERTAALLTDQLDHKLIAEQGNRFRFAASDQPGNFVDVLCFPESIKALAGSGTVHHIAFATPDQGTQTDVRLRILNRMLNPTPVLDRTYFTSIYFREPGGVLFEVATSVPGFSVDEPVEHLGETLRLPATFESERASIESRLLPISINLKDYI